jgi:RecA-family ATPase
MKKHIEEHINPLQDPIVWKNHITELAQNTIESEKGLFKILSANEWLEMAKKTPIPKMLFGEFWFEGEICVLFSDTNLGKSILSVQIADSISRGKEIDGLKLEAQKQVVLYFDFELSMKQFEARYSEKDDMNESFFNHHNFDENFIRIEIDPNSDIPLDVSFEEHLNNSFERCIIEKNAKILIIDNITWLKNETERSKDALPLMKFLKGLKSKYNLSILALAHTPKRDLSRPITQNDLGGSKMISNFIDTCFAIGQSNIETGLRYIKQLKARYTSMIYDAENVIVCQIDKPTNFLGFEILDFSSEREHLKKVSEKDQEDRINEVMELKKQGQSNVQIAKQFGVSEGAIRKWIKKGSENE